MTTTTVNKTPRTLIAAGTIQAAGTVTSGTTTNQRQAAAIDLRTVMPGSRMTMKITNGATGPNTPCECRILIAHSSSPTQPAFPAVGTPLAGVDWKTVWSFNGGTTANAVTEQAYDAGADMWTAVEYTGNTGQAVTVEAYLSEITSASTVP